MKTLRNALFALLLGAVTLFGAGTVNQFVTLQQNNLTVVEFTCTGDSSTGSFPSTVTNDLVTSAIVGKYLAMAVTIPGATAPTANYDIAITEDGVDVMSSLLADRSASAVEQVFSPRGARPISGPLTIAITNNSNASAGVRVKLYFSQNLASQGASPFQTGPIAISGALSATGNLLVTGANSAFGTGASIVTSSTVAINGSLNAVSGNARGILIQGTYAASANSDSLYGMQIAMNTNVGAYTGTTAYGLYVGAPVGAATNIGIYNGGTLTQANTATITPTTTLAGTVADTQHLYIQPVLTAGSAQTNTRMNYITLVSPTLTNVTVTSGAAFRFDAAIGTHPAVDSGSTKTSPGTVTAWIKVNINGTIHYIPCYSSKTT